MTQDNVIQSLLVTLSGSFQTSPTFFLDPHNGVSYNIAVQAPQYGLDSLAALNNMPITVPNSAPPANTAASTMAPGAAPGAASAVTAPLSPTPATAAPGAAQPVQVLGNVASIVPGNEMGTVSHYDILPVLDIYANVNGTDLGSVTRAMQKIIARHQKD
jgi:multidrug efflux pump subunit AcrB